MDALYYVDESLMTGLTDVVVMQTFRLQILSNIVYKNVYKP